MYFSHKGDYQCKPINICRTCSTFAAYGGKCQEIDIFPNATVAEYGTVTGVDNMKAEVSYSLKLFVLTFLFHKKLIKKNSRFSDEDQSLVESTPSQC